MVNAVEMQGICLCGAVRVTAKAMDPKVGVCHCKMCRTWTGGPFFAADCGSGVTFEGEEHIAVFSSSDWAERGFCRTCGTHLFYRLKEGRQHFMPVGLFTDGKALVFDHQVFIEEKPEFYQFANETHNMTGAELFAQFSAAQQ